MSTAEAPEENAEEATEEESSVEESAEELTEEAAEPARAAKAEEGPVSGDSNGSLSAKATAASVLDRKRPNRDITASALLRLLGVPSTTDLHLIESKLDVLSQKITNLSLKLDRMRSLETLNQDIDRIDVQLTDVKQLLTALRDDAGSAGNGDKDKAGSAARS